MGKTTRQMKKWSEKGMKGGAAVGGAACIAAIPVTYGLSIFLIPFGILGGGAAGFVVGGALPAIGKGVKETYRGTKNGINYLRARGHGRHHGHGHHHHSRSHNHIPQGQPVYDPYAYPGQHVYLAPVNQYGQQIGNGFWAQQTDRYNPQPYHTAPTQPHLAPHPVGGRKTAERDRNVNFSDYVGGSRNMSGSHADDYTRRQSASRSDSTSSFSTDSEEDFLRKLPESSHRTRFRDKFSRHDKSEDYTKVSSEKSSVGFSYL